MTIITNTITFIAAVTSVTVGVTTTTTHHHRSKWRLVTRLLGLGFDA